MRTNFGNIPQSLKASNMAPLDAKAVVNTLNELKDLGPNNRKAFTYYDSMVVYCHEDKKKYKWTDDLKGHKRLLKNDFKYPKGTIFDSIDYSDRLFNFIEETSSSSIIIRDVKSETVVIELTSSILEKNGNKINHNLNLKFPIKETFILEKALEKNSVVSYSPSDLILFGIIKEYNITNNYIELKGWENHEDMKDNDVFYLILEYIPNE